MNRQDTCSTKSEFYCTVFLNRLSGLFHKQEIFLWGGLLARPSDLTFALQTQQNKLSFLCFIKIVVTDQNYTFAAIWQLRPEGHSL